jgi:hypothetical protein
MHFSYFPYVLHTCWYDHGDDILWRVWSSRFDLRQRQRIFLLASASRPTLGPTQTRVQWVPGVLSPGVKCSWGVMLITHLHPVPTLRMSRSYTSSHPMRLHGV